MTKILLPLIIFAVLTLTGIIIFAVSERTRFKKKEIIYSILSLLLLGSTGLLAMVWQPILTPRHFLIHQLLFLVLGVLHAVFLYNTFLWSKRDRVNQSADSFWPELAFTTFIGGLGALIFLLAYAWQVPAYAAAFSWSCLLFWLPFIALKTMDFALQVPKPSFDWRWYYPSGGLDDRELKWDNPIKLYFQVAQTLRDENKMGGNELMWVEPSENEVLGTAFRLGIREFNRDAEDEPIADLGFEPGSSDIWWAFRVKFVLWKPHTWGRQRFLNPKATLRANNIRDEDIVLAKRVAKQP